MVIISFCPRRDPVGVKYRVEGEVLVAVADGEIERFDFSNLGNGRAITILSSLPSCPVLSAERVNGVLHIRLLRAIPPRPADPTTLEEWKSLWTEESLDSDFVDEVPDVPIADAIIEWRSQQDIEAEREALAWALLREKRDHLLAKCDWTQLPDVPMSSDLRQAWQAYRQALRDVPQQEGAPHDVTWPEPPQML